MLHLIVLALHVKMSKQRDFNRKSRSQGKTKQEKKEDFEALIRIAALFF